MWRQSVYAFILRKVLGPYLSEESLGKLHKSIEFAIGEGKYNLKNIDLRTDYLNDGIIGHVCGGILIKKISVKSLTINLNLDDGLDESGSKKVHVLKKMYMLGAKGKNVNISLACHLDLEGIEIEVARTEKDHSKQSRKLKKKHSMKESDNTNEVSNDKSREEKDGKEVDNTDTNTSIISSYIDAALKSLKLSFKLSEVFVKIVGISKQKSVKSVNTITKYPWVALYLSSVSLNKLITPYNNADSVYSAGTMSQERKILLEADISFVDIKLTAGSDNLPSKLDTPNQNKRFEVASMIGLGSIKLQVMSFRDANESSSDIKVDLDGAVSVSTDTNTLIQLLAVIKEFISAFTQNSEDDLRIQNNDLSDCEQSIENETSESKESIECCAHIDESEADHVVSIIKERQRLAYEMADKEIRGGMLVPNESYHQSNDSSIMYDAFFDANEIFTSSDIEKEFEDTNKNRSSDFVHTRLSVNIRQGSIKLFFAQSDEDERKRNDFALLSLGYVCVICSFSSERFDININFCHAELGYHIAKGDSDQLSPSSSKTFLKLIKFNVLEENDFFDEFERSHTCDCISIHIGLIFSEKGNKIDIDVIFQPIIFSCQHLSILISLWDSIMSIIHMILSMLPESNEVAYTNIITLRIECDLVTLHTPFVVDKNAKKDHKIPIYLSSSEFENNEQGLICLPSLELLIDQFKFVFGNGDITNRHNDTSTDAFNYKFICNCQKLIFGIIFLPNHSYLESPSTNVKRFNILTFESDTLIDSNASVSLEFESLADSTKDKGKSFFPIVPDLSSVKASQEEGEQHFEAHEKKIPDKIRRNVRGSDPQPMMQSAASKCDYIFSLYIPSLNANFSPNVKDVFIYLLARLGNNISSLQNEDNTNQQDRGPSSVLGFAIKCNRICLGLHQDQKITDIRPSFSYILIFDEIFSHFLLCGGLKNIRLFWHDFTVYEGQSTPSDRGEETQFFPERTIIGRCKAITQKMMKMRMVKPIFLRSKLSYPLSPMTPAFKFDLVTSEINFENEIERSIYVSLYDMTHRFNLESNWIENISKFFRNGQSDNSSDVNIDTKEECKVSSVTNLFVTISDTNFDYTSPLFFHRPSQTCARVGEIRISSNIIVPNGPITSFKVSVSDVGVYLSNNRSCHMFENSRLSCAKVFLDSKDQSSTELSEKKLYKTIEEAYQQMDFVLVASLDCFDAFVNVRVSNDTSKIDDYVTNSTNMPEIFLRLAIGRTYFYTCRDSFACFLETIQELVTQLTVPSPDEVKNIIKEESSKLAKNSCKNCKKERTLSDSSLVQESNQDKFVHQSIDSKQQRDNFTLTSLMEDTIFTSPTDDYHTKTSNIHQCIQDHELQSGVKKKKLRSKERVGIFSSKSYAQKCNEISSSKQDDQIWTTVDYQWANDANIPEGGYQSARWFDKTPLRHFPQKGINSKMRNDINSELEIDHDHFTKHHFSHSLTMEDATPATFYQENLPKVKFKVFLEDLTLFCRFFDGLDWHSSKSKSALFDVMMEDLQPSLHDSESMKNTICSRQTKKFFQVFASGIRLKLDSFEEVPGHCIASCLDLILSDFFVSENLSGQSPRKMIGEWSHGKLYPRDSNDGMFMIKIVFINPGYKISADKQLLSNEAFVTLEILPIRCVIYQVAIDFMRGFFSQDNQISNQSDLNESENKPSETFFRVVKIKPLKLKIDYVPPDFDAKNLTEGSFVELINIVPIENLHLVLDLVQIRNLSGWGSILSELIDEWVSEILSSHLHKFVLSASPLEPISSTFYGVRDFLVIPLGMQSSNQGSKRSVQEGAKELLGTITDETLNVTAKLTQCTSKKLRKLYTEEYRDNVDERRKRPMDHLLEGFKDANTTLVHVPYKVYRQKGAKGAGLSVLRGIPVLIIAPLGGVTAAVSKTVTNARTHLNTSYREEQEEARRGLEDHI